MFLFLRDAEDRDGLAGTAFVVLPKAFIEARTTSTRANGWYYRSIVRYERGDEN